MKDGKTCTALMKREDAKIQYLRCSASYVNGHAFLRELGWRCSRCWCERPKTLLASQIDDCKGGLDG